MHHCVGLAAQQRPQASSLSDSYSPPSVWGLSVLLNPPGSALLPLVCDSVQSEKQRAGTRAFFHVASYA